MDSRYATYSLGWSGYLLTLSPPSHDQLDLQLQDESGGDISSFITNGEWDLLGEWDTICRDESD